MALTITGPTGPQSWIPSGNEIVYTITTTTNWRNDLYFLIDVLINSNTVITLRKYPLQNQQSVKIDLREIVDVYLENKPYIHANNTLFETTTLGTVLDLRITVNEWWAGDVWDTQTSLPVYVWKASQQFLDHRDQLNVSYFEREFTASSTLTVNGNHGRPMGYHKTVGINASIINVLPSGWELLPLAKDMAYKMNRNFFRDVHLFSNYTSGTNYIIYYGFDEDGKLIKKAFTHPGSTPTGDVNKHLFRFAVNPKANDLSNYVPNTASNMLDCKYIVVVISSSYHMQLDYIESFISQPLVFEICDAEESYSIWYKSYEGGWNIIQCNNRVVEETSVDTITRENARPTTWTYTSRLISPVYITAHSKWTLNTDWVDKYENEDIKDMLQSPCLFIQYYKDGKLNYIPVTLSNASFTTKDVNSKNLFNYKFEFEESFYKNTVRP